MIFWTTAALLTLCACLAVLTPVLRGGSSRAEESGHDIEVYRDQLAELDGDLRRGVIDADEAEQARAEIGRRLLRVAAKGKDHRGSRGSGRLARTVLTAAVLLVPLVSWGVYTFTGSPQLPAQPLQARLDRDPAQASVEELVARAERHLAANPTDGRGWDVLAPIYFRAGRYEDAVTAYRNAIRLVGATADREIGLGEAIAAAAGGVIATDAQAAFQRALVLEPRNMRARYLMANGLFQEGKMAEATGLLEGMLRDAEPDSPWRSVVEQALASIKRPDPAGSTEGEAQGGSEDERPAMIEAMVANLDARLREDPADPQGWQRLVHSYVVLQRLEKAADALARGVAALGPDSDAARELISFAAARGVSATE